MVASNFFAVKINTGQIFLTHPLDGAKKFWPTPQGGLKNFWPTPIFRDPPTPYLMNTPLTRGVNSEILNHHHSTVDIFETLKNDG